jgi:hypothetical protein
MFLFRIPIPLFPVFLLRDEWEWGRRSTGNTEREWERGTRMLAPGSLAQKLRERIGIPTLVAPLVESLTGSCHTGSRNQVVSGRSGGFGKGIS